MKTAIVGIDSGVNGGVCAIFPNGEAKASPIGSIAELCDFLTSAHDISVRQNCLFQVFVEEVTGYIGGKPQPASRSFVLGKSYGSILGLLIGLSMPFRTVRPQKWQQGYSGIRGVEYSARKRKLREHAVMRYPQLKPTLKTADAILIADYGKGVLQDNEA